MTQHERNTNKIVVTHATHSGIIQTIRVRYSHRRIIVSSNIYDNADTGKTSFGIIEICFMYCNLNILVYSNTITQFLSNSIYIEENHYFPLVQKPIIM